MKRDIPSFFHFLKGRKGEFKVTTNKGKVFEDEFKASVPNDVYLYRLTDSASGFSGGTITRFAVKNPFDFLMFTKGVLMPLELKTTSHKSISFDPKPRKTKSSNMIKWHQIEGLLEANKYGKIRSGFLFQFANIDKGYKRTYWMSIGDFFCMVESFEGKKKSFTEKDLKNFRAFEVFGKLKRTRYTYDVTSLIKHILMLDSLNVPKSGNYSISVYEPPFQIDFEALKAKGVTFDGKQNYGL